MAENEKLSPDVFVKLTLEHEGRFFASVFAMLPGCSDAEDIVHDAVAVMWQKSDQFQPGTNFAAWGSSITRFKAMDYIRDQNSSEVVLSPTALELVVADVQKSSDQLAARADALKDCVEKLEPADNELVRLRFQPRMTLKATASELGKSEVTVRRWTRKILARLEACLTDTIGMETQS